MGGSKGGTRRFACFRARAATAQGFGNQSRARRMTLAMQRNLWLPAEASAGPGRAQYVGGDRERES